MGDLKRSYVVARGNVTDQMQRTYAEDKRATDRGACGVAILIAEQFTGLLVQNVAPLETGYDYWLGDSPTDDDNFLRDNVRVEVSGIRSGNLASARRRNKVKQERGTVDRTDPTPFYVIVVVFNEPFALVVRR